VVSVGPGKVQLLFVGGYFLLVTFRFADLLSVSYTLSGVLYNVEFTKPNLQSQIYKAKFTKPNLQSKLQWLILIRKVMLNNEDNKK